jgi:4-amino-4-deoxy-L-arabinose transferase-like glycosyltransferase
LLVSLPAIATLAAFALPTLRRSLSAWIDWFTLLFFSGCALVVWVVWIAMQTGIPAQPAANVARLVPGFTPEFSAPTLVLALSATLAWFGLVKWRIGHHRTAIWKSMVLPASGAVLCWLLVMSLWLPLLDFARSYAPMVKKVLDVTGPVTCLQYAGISRAQGTAFQFHGQVQLLSLQAPQEQCRWLIVDRVNLSLLSAKLKSLGWIEAAKAPRVENREESIVIFKPKATGP